MLRLGGLCGFATAAVWAGHSAAEDIDVVETLLTSDAASERDARTSEASTAFVTDRTGTRDVFVLDGLGILTIAAGGPGNQDNPDIDGDLVVYVDDSLGNLDIGLVDLAAGSNQHITTDLGRDSDPVIDDELVAFVTRRTGSSDIMVYDIITGVLSFAAQTPIEEVLPALDAGLLAWTVFQNASFDVMARNVDGPPFLVAAGPGNEYAPSVSGGRIAYVVDGDVAVFDLATGLTTRLTQDAFDQTNVVIESDWVVWNDDRNGNYDVFLYDLSSHLTYQLTEDPSDQVLGDLDAERVVFHDNRLGDFNIWELDITINHAVEVDVRVARVSRPQRGNLGRVSMTADLGVAQPGPDDLFAIEMDGVVLFTEPFSAFTPDALQRWTLRRSLLSVDIDLHRHELKVHCGRVDVSGIDNSNGVDVLVHIGDALGIDHIVMQERGQGLEYRRPD